MVHGTFLKESFRWSSSIKEFKEKEPKEPKMSFSHIKVCLLDQNNEQTQDAVQYIPAGTKLVAQSFEWSHGKFMTIVNELSSPPDNQDFFTYPNCKLEISLKES